MPLSSAATVCLLEGGTFLFAGVWKYWRMLESPDHRAPVYVDIAHRASFLYRFARVVD